MTAMVLLSSWMASQVEFWKPVQGFPGYDVSSFGRVRSWWTLRNVNRGGLAVLGQKTRAISRHFDKRGYPRVGIYPIGPKTGRPRVLTVHRLVAIAFLPNSEGKPQVNHLNAVKADNRCGNLNWATRSENVRHGFDNGLYDNAIRRGENNHLTVYSDEQVEGIRQLYARGITKYLISKATGLNPSTVGRIVNGKARVKEKIDGNFGRFTRGCPSAIETADWGGM